MQYDPVKDKIGSFVRKHPTLRKLFYFLLHLLFLREWYVRKKIRLLYGRDDKISVLDAGSGFGQYSYFMSKYIKSAEIVSVDVKEDYLNDCREFFSRLGIRNVTFESADLTKIKYENKFDFILSVDVMEHISEDTEVFGRFYRALKNGGKLLINSPSDLGGSDVKSEEDESFIGEHVRTGYSKEEICGKLASSGFEIESFEYTYGFWGNIYWKICIKYPMLMLNTSRLFFLILPIYYSVIILPSLVFMYLDTLQAKKTRGTGILVIANKPKAD